jgi:outer membrane lipoprotein carrier protein
MKAILRLLVIIFVFSFQRPDFTFSGELNVDQVLQMMEETNLQLEDIQADFVQTKEMALFNERIVSKGKFYFRNPDKLILDTKFPDHQQLIINHNRVWLHYPELKQVHEYSTKQSKGLDALFVGFGGSVKNIRQQFSVSMEKTEKDRQGKNSYTLALCPLPGTPAASPALNLERVVLTVAESNWYPLKTQIVQKNGDRTILEYSNHKVNLKLSEARFTFIPPAGTEVIDHSERSGVTQ